MIIRVYRTIRNFLRANFIAGLFIAVPVGVTVAALVWVWGKVNKPLEQIFNAAAKTEEFPWAGVGEAIQKSDQNYLLIPLTSLALVLLAVLLIGLITRSLLGRLALGGVEGLVARVPIVGMLYSSLKQLGEAFITTDGKSKFQRAVAVQFPYRGCWAIGFVTGRAEAVFQLPIPPPPPSPAGAAARPTEMLTIFVPTTPLPTQGFMLVVPDHETVALKLTVQEALKMVVSGGMINPGESQRMPQPELKLTPRRDSKALKAAPESPSSAPDAAG